MLGRSEFSVSSIKATFQVIFALDKDDLLYFYRLSRKSKLSFKTQKMKNTLFFLMLLSASFTFGQKNKQLKAYIDHKCFYAPSLGNYVEIQMQFVGYTLNYKPIANDLQAEVAVQLKITQNGNTIKSDAYLLKSPLLRDSIVDDFYDLKRFTVPAGNYEIEVSLEDVNNSNKAMTGKLPLEVRDLSKIAGFSDIQVAEVMTPTETPSTFSKSGYDMVPRISNYYPEQTNSIPVYFEVYSHDEKQTVFGLKQTVYSTKTKQEIEALTRFSKLEVNQIQPVIRNLDIQELYSGEYVLEFSLLSKENQELAKTTYYFERSKEFTGYVDVEKIVLDPAFQASITDDSVFFYMESLIPISRPAEVKNILSILKKKDTENCRKHIQAFWAQSSNGANVYESWMKYKQQVQLVQRLYKNNFMEGFETDRGRVYLQYGPPNSIISRETSPSEYPYEIWVYDKIRQFSNKRFIFYNPDLVPNSHRLLHSDMIGELQNYRWQQALAKRNSPNRNIDDPNDGNNQHFGGNSQELYEQR